MTLLHDVIILDVYQEKKRKENVESDRPRNQAATKIHQVSEIRQFYSVCTLVFHVRQVLPNLNVFYRMSFSFQN